MTSLEVDVVSDRKKNVVRSPVPAPEPSARETQFVPDTFVPDRLGASREKPLAASKLSRIEALRGLAAVYVVLHHTVPEKFFIAGHNVGFLGRFGQEAVILFFLLSGFVIRYSFEFSRDKSFANYFQKRFLRIYLPLLVVFFLGFLSKSYNAGQWVHLNIPTLLGNLLMLQDWADAKPHIIVDAFLSNDPLWSLAYEWWFYMMFFPLISFIGSSVVRDRCVFAIAGAAAIGYVMWPVFPLRILMYMGIWWTGVVAAQAFLLDQNVRWQQMRLPVCAMLFITLVLSVGVYLQKQQGAFITLGYHPLLEVRHFVFAILAVAGAFLWAWRNWIGFNIFVAPFGWFAPISYVIYIGHYHLFSDATYLNFIANPILQWCSYFCVVVVVSYLIERRFYPFARNHILAWTRQRGVNAKS